MNMNYPTLDIEQLFQKLTEFGGLPNTEMLPHVTSRVPDGADTQETGSLGAGPVVLFVWQPFLRHLVVVVIVDVQHPVHQLPTGCSRFHSPTWALFRRAVQSGQRQCCQMSLIYARSTRCGLFFSHLVRDTVSTITRREQEDMSRTEDLATKLRTLSYDHDRLLSIQRAATELAANAERETNLHKARLACVRCHHLLNFFSDTDA